MKRVRLDRQSGLRILSNIIGVSISALSDAVPFQLFLGESRNLEGFWMDQTWSNFAGIDGEISSDVFINYLKFMNEFINCACTWCKHNSFTLLIDAQLDWQWHRYNHAHTLTYLYSLTYTDIHILKSTHSDINLCNQCIGAEAQTHSLSSTIFLIAGVHNKCANAHIFPHKQNIHNIPVHANWHIQDQNM